MEKFVEKIQAFVGPFAEKVSKNKFLTALSETLQVLMPVTVVGSFAILLAFINITPWQNFLTANPLVKNVFMLTGTWTLSSFAFWTVVVLPFRYSEKIGLKESLSTVAITAAVFLIFSQSAPFTAQPMDFMGHQGLITAIILGIGIPAVIKLFIDKNIKITMPKGVPTFVTDTFTVLIPAAVILLVAALISQLVAGTEIGTVHNAIYVAIQTPLKNVGLSFPSLLLVEIVMTLLMFTGIHGGIAMSYMNPLLMAANAENMAAMAAGEVMPNVMVRGLVNSIQAGGIGATLGLGLVLFFFAKSERYKKLSRVAIVPQIFNIGEPLLFGVPIVLNPFLFIPYMGGVLVNTFLIYGLVYFGVIGKFTGVDVNWTIPMVIQGILSHSSPLVGGLIQAAIVAIDALIWYPFVKIIDNKALEAEKAGK